MVLIAIGIGALPVFLFTYAYLGYPLLLWVVCRGKPQPHRSVAADVWPDITITVPCHNEERAIEATIGSLLALDYPVGKRHILIISDASTDRTEQIVSSFADLGVELLCLPVRAGKTAAENAASKCLRGDIVVSTDATIRILPGALKELVAVFQDPTIGVASGRDISVGAFESVGNHGESGYVGYEMWIRSLETRIGTIVGASGCFFATRRELYARDFPEALSRDFASCLIAREHGYRSVSVDTAVALVPRSASIRSEYHRKVRTMARGLGTLYFKRHLLDPFRYGVFAFMLISHKLCRWLFQLTMPLAVLGAVVLALTSPWVALWVIGVTVMGAGVAALAWWWPAEKPMPGLASASGYLIWANVAGLMAWAKFLRNEYQPVWEPTRRPQVSG